MGKFLNDDTNSGLWNKQLTFTLGDKTQTSMFNLLFSAAKSWRVSSWEMQIKHRSLSFIAYSESKLFIICIS